MRLELSHEVGYVGLSRRADPARNLFDRPTQLLVTIEKLHVHVHIGCRGAAHHSAIHHSVAAGTWLDTSAEEVQGVAKQVAASRTERYQCTPTS